MENTINKKDIRGLSKDELIEELNTTYQRELLWKEKYEELSQAQDNTNNFKSLFDQSAQGYWEWDFATNTEFLTPSYTKMLGFEHHEFPNIQSAWKEMIHPDDLEELMRSFEQHVATKGKSSFHNIARWKGKNDKTIWVYCKGQIISWTDEGQPQKLIGYHVDISDSKELKKIKKEKVKLNQKNKELHRVNEEINRFMYSASHDLKSPVVSALGLLELISENENKKEQKNYLELISKSLHTLEHFISKIIDTLKIQNIALNSNKINLNKLMSEVVNALQFLPNFNKVDIQWVNEDFEWYSDEYRLKLILSNLISNSIKYANVYQEESYVRLKFTSKDNIGTVVIQDNGVGIKKTDQESIFDMFYRATDNNQGTGLGLYIVKETLMTLNGKVDLESEVNKGTKFTITLPLSEKL
ncbi:sensor histidine kinase [Flammeovirga agarivorans]|uniref:histidine kinase n=1 Tax=Flammeovirga agarivorans TaxID=2726742 RepID=A0A7X8XUS4_9BACT|nr:PAS domain-containing sensor histidine kinase [Flammeovirga agarivorans]NLR90648.1 PAS domain-containing protein [Flammeovirga agarivorans]